MSAAKAALRLHGLGYTARTAGMCVWVSSGYNGAYVMAETVLGLTDAALVELLCNLVGEER